jgi:RNA polymerase sigma-70 factor, ECF subfamily
MVTPGMYEPNPASAADRDGLAADREWYERCVVELLPGLFGAALRLTRNHADAEDLVAEAVTRGWSHRAELTDRGRLRGWLFRILTNTFLTGRRTAARRGEHTSIDEGAGEGFSLFEQLHAPVLLWWGTPERAFLDKLLREDVARAVDALPDAFRVVLVLADLQGCTYQEIADILQVPIGTVRSRLARARGLLQHALWTHAREAGLVGARQESDNRS